MLLRICREENPEDAEDLVQEAYLRYLEANHRSPVANEEGYLITVIRNLLPDFWSGRNQRTAASRAFKEILEQMDEESGIDAALSPDVEKQQELLRLAMERLPPSLLKAIELDMQGVPDAQIASQLGIAVTSVKKYLSRARARLKSIMLQEAEHADD
jgi:RNA polymerase sigma-70 factor (ECF subfamily)